MECICFVLCPCLVIHVHPLHRTPQAGAAAIAAAETEAATLVQALAGCTDATAAHAEEKEKDERALASTLAANGA